MSKRKKSIICLAVVLSMLGIFLTGCMQVEEKATEAVSKVTEIPVLPSFIPEPDRTVTEVDLPDAYNYLEDNSVPALRNQGNTNTCWAFASLSALEASKDIEDKRIFSADHLIYQNPFGKTFEAGGSYVVTMAYLLSWKGPVYEERDSFDGVLEENVESDLHVQEIRQIEPKDYDAIKKISVFIWCCRIIIIR